MAQPFQKNTLNQSEKYQLTEFLKSNIGSCNNKTSAEIAEYCNEFLKFPRKDGKEIKIVAKHVDNVYQILLDMARSCGIKKERAVWTKKEKKKTFSIWDLMKKIEDVENRVSDLESDRLTEIHAELDEGTFDGTRDQQESIQRYSS